MRERDEVVIPHYSPVANLKSNMGFSVDGQVRRSQVATQTIPTNWLTGLQSIIIAGGSKGLGRELAAQLVQRGIGFAALINLGGADKIIHQRCQRRHPRTEHESPRNGKGQSIAFAQTPGANGWH
jgi:succinyl-CoA synthetase alpha subunit